MERIKRRWARRLRRKGRFYAAVEPDSQHSGWPFRVKRLAAIDAWFLRTVTRDPWVVYRFGAGPTSVGYSPEEARREIVSAHSSRAADDERLSLD